MARNRNSKRTSSKSRNTKNSSSQSPNRSDNTRDKLDDKGEVDKNSTSTNNDDGKLQNKKGSINPANDPAWYSRDEALLRDAASLPFSLPFGADVPIFPTSTPIPGVSTQPYDLKNHSIPGVCTLVVKPSMGFNMDKSSPANVCANALYTHIRYNNSGRKNYDPADIFIYVATFGEIYSFLMWCIRLYNYAYMYSQRNWYLAKDLILANGVDPDDIVSNLANFRYWINSMINKISSFCVPADIDYFKRRVWLFSNYYIENPYGNLKDQMYQLAPEGFYKFELESEFHAGKLHYERLPNIGDDGEITSYMKVSKLSEIFESLMENITGDEDFGLMSGDILKSYQGNIITLSQIGEEGGILPVYDPYVLSQFKNATVIDYVYRGDNDKKWTDGLGHTHVFGDIEQMTNGLIVSVESYDYHDDYMPQNASRGVYLSMTHPISVENPVPGPGDVIEATRFVATLKNFINNNTSDYAIVCGSDIVVNLRISKQPYDKTTQVYPESFGCYKWSNASGFENPNGVEWAITVAHFKYIPLCWVINFDAQREIDDVKLISNMENVALCSKEILTRLHEVALLSLFYVPGVAKII